MREYAVEDDGEELLAEDRMLMAKLGYELKATEETDGWERDSRVIRALFVKPSLMPSTPASDNAEPEPEHS
jgi:hypothetical protein